MLYVEKVRRNQRKYSLKMRTGAQRRAQESPFDVCSPSIFSQKLKFTLARFEQLLSTWMFPVRTCGVRGAGSATTHSIDEWCAKKSPGKFIRYLLTLNLIASTEVHAGQVRTLLEHLDVACSYVVRSYWKADGQERSNKGCGLVRKRKLQEIAPAAHLPGC